MESKKLLIVGIDPGTTLGYSILDIDGNLLKAGSSKNLGLNQLISEVIKIGKVVIVGTDKKIVPDFVCSFATKTGARLISPQEDMKVEEKRELAREFDVKDSHQTDSLASALFAYKRISPLLNKINVYVDEKNKHAIKDRLMEIVLLRKISIKGSADIIEKPDKEEVKIMRKVIHEKKLKEDDFIKLYNKLKSYEREFGLLRQQNQKFIMEIERLKQKESYLEKKIHYFRGNQKNKSLLDFKEKRILLFDKELGERKKEISRLKEEVNRLSSLPFDYKDKIFLKKLANLSYSEFEKKKPFLNIQEGDSLFVDDANIINNEVLDSIKDKVKIIVSNTKINDSTRQKIHLPLIEAYKLNLIEDKNFVMANRSEIEKEIKKTNIIKKIVEDYKRENIFC